MQLVHTVSALRDALKAHTTTALVPTMGNLHAGHISLIKLAQQHGQPVVASIFVNPLQFGPGEDFERYPRTLDADCENLAAAGCSLVIAPDVSELYPQPQTFTVEPSAAFSNELCGLFRPGHFNGVATVVLKLFHLVQPRTALFGRKDYQQLLLVRELVRQFNLPIEIIGGNTQRETDGLAMSSRNVFLSPAQRIQGGGLFRELNALIQAVMRGEQDFDALAATATKHLKMAGWTVDYVTLRDADTLQPPRADTRRIVALGAAWLGKTRLIDNIETSSPGLPG